jgi:LPXTG-motif cell wall-anchored protein
LNSILKQNRTIEEVIIMKKISMIAAAALAILTLGSTNASAASSPTQMPKSMNLVDNSNSIGVVEFVQKTAASSSTSSTPAPAGTSSTPAPAGNSALPATGEAQNSAMAVAGIAGLAATVVAARRKF